MKVEEKAKELYPELDVIPNGLDYHKNDLNIYCQMAFVDGYNYANQPTTTETLQEGDWTKCEKFSEWVALFEFEGSNSSFDQFWRDEFNEFNGEVKATDGINLDGILLWGKGENFLPYQEFKQRAENTFKTK